MKETKSKEKKEQPRDVWPKRFKATLIKPLSLATASEFPYEGRDDGDFGQ
jgi:hypothetical protein